MSVTYAAETIGFAAPACALGIIDGREAHELELVHEALAFERALTLAGKAIGDCFKMQEWTGYDLAFLRRRIRDAVLTGNTWEIGAAWAQVQRLEEELLPPF